MVVLSVRPERSGDYSNRGSRNVLTARERRRDSRTADSNRTGAARLAVNRREDRGLAFAEPGEPSGVATLASTEATSRAVEVQVTAESWVGVQAPLLARFRVRTCPTRIFPTKGVAFESTMLAALKTHQYPRSKFPHPRRWEIELGETRAAAAPRSHSEQARHGPAPRSRHAIVSRWRGERPCCRIRHRPPPLVLVLPSDASPSPAEAPAPSRPNTGVKRRSSEVHQCFVSLDFLLARILTLREGISDRVTVAAGDRTARHLRLSGQ